MPSTPVIRLTAAALSGHVVAPVGRGRADKRPAPRSPAARATTAETASCARCEGVADPQYELFHKLPLWSTHSLAGRALRRATGTPTA